MGGCCGREESGEGSRIGIPIIMNPEWIHRNLLIFVNPHSGKGKGLKIFEEQVAPKLACNFIKYEMILTEGPNHARNVLMTKQDLGKFNGILILSGDGLVFEAVNGLLCRPDAFQMLPALPIGIVPTGSGNGLLCSVLVKYGLKLEPTIIMNKALAIATSPSARAESVALYSVKTDCQEYAAFLSIGWGLMADIDIESEKWRKSLGPHRFPVMGFIRSCNLRSYKGRLTYRYYEPKKYEKSSNKFNVYDLTAEERIEDTRSSELPASILKQVVPVPTTWTPHTPDSGIVEEVTIEDTFINVYAVALSHISAEGPFALDAKLEDNRIHLTYILLKDIGSRIDIIKYLLAIEQGRHLEFPFVKHVEVSSMKLEVDSNDSYIVLDGEVIDTTSIEVKSTDNHFSVFSTVS